MRTLIAILLLLIAAPAYGWMNPVMIGGGVSAAGGTGCGINIFSTDANAVAWWCLEETEGNREDGSGNGNELVDNNTVLFANDPPYVGAGANQADFEGTNSEYLSRADASLDSSFPLKVGGSGVFSITWWAKFETVSSVRNMVSKADYGTGSGYSFTVRVDGNGGDVVWYIGHTGGSATELLVDSADIITVAQWYHFGITFDDTDKTWQLRVWGDTEASVVLNVSGTATNNISLTSTAFLVGVILNSGSPSFPYDGLIDEVVVFDDILTTGEIDEIRAGTYNGP